MHFWIHPSARSYCQSCRPSALRAKPRWAAPLSELVRDLRYSGEAAQVGQVTLACHDGSHLNGDGQLEPHRGVRVYLLFAEAEVVDELALPRCIFHCADGWETTNGRGRSGLVDHRCRRSGFAVGLRVRCMLLFEYWRVWWHYGNWWPRRVGDGRRFRQDAAIARIAFGLHRWF